MIIKYIKILFYLLFISAEFCFLTKKRFSYNLSLSLLSTSLNITLLSILINNIRLSFLIVNILYMLLSLYKLIKIMKEIKKELKKFLSNYLEPSFILFLVMYVFICTFHNNTNITTYDEIIFWAPLTKEMYYNNCYHFNSSSAFFNSTNYPPLFQTMELMFLFVGSGFFENILYIALSVFTFSLFLPTLKKNDSKVNYLLLILCFILLNLSNYVIEHSSFDKFESIFQTIQLDQMVGLLPAFGMYLVIVNDDWDYYNLFFLISILSGIVLTKQISLALAIMVVFFYFLKKFIQRKKIVIKDLFLLVPFLYLMLWNLACKISHVKHPLITNKTLLTATVKNNEFIRTVVSNFKDAVFNSPIIEVFGIKLNYIVLNLIIGILIFYVVNKIKNKKEAVITVMTFDVGWVGYCLTILLLYLTVFTYDEAILTASYERYMGTIIYFGLALLTFLVLHYSCKKLSILFVLLLFILTSITNFKILNIKEKYNYTQDYKFVELKKQFNYYLNNKDEKILVVSQDDYPYMWAYINYEFNNLDFEIVFNGFICSSDKTSSYYDNNNDYYEIMDLISFDNYIKKFDYIYIYQYDNNFEKDYWTNKNEVLLNDRLYKVNENRVLILPWNNEW